MDRLVKRLVGIQEDITALWAVNPNRLDVLARYTDPVENWVAELQLANLEIWELENEARREHDPKLTYTRQEVNKYRNNLISWLDRWFVGGTSGQLATETPGMLLDRLSILEIKRAAGGNVREQKLNLMNGLTALLVDVRDGLRHYKIYDPIKIYTS